MMYYENIQQAMGVDIAISTEIGTAESYCGIKCMKTKHPWMTQAWMF